MHIASGEPRLICEFSYEGYNGGATTARVIARRL